MIAKVMVFWKIFESAMCLQTCAMWLFGEWQTLKQTSGGASEEQQLKEGEEEEEEEQVSK
jgi:hypothetical protein